MRKCIKQIILTLLLIIPTLAFALDAATNHVGNQTIRKEKGAIDESSRPKAPSNQCIFFAYDAANGDCIFSLPVDVEYIDIELTGTDNQVVYIGSVDSLNPVWHQTLSSGEYYIVCTADNGDIYSGYIYI